MEIYKALAISVPFQIFLIWKYGISAMTYIYFPMGLLAIYMWIREYKQNKIKKQYWQEIKQTISWI
jgi:nicotinamide riboside transporter PnuC